MDGGGASSAEKAGKNLSPPLHFLKLSSGPDWTLCGADSGPGLYV